MDTLDTTMGVSAFDRLKAKRRRNAHNTTVDLPVTGYSGELVARYRLLDPLIEGKEIADRIDEQFKGEQEAQTFWALVDTLISACDGLYVKGDHGFEPLDPDGGGVCRYDERLADGLDLERGSARITLLSLFDDNKVAITHHALALQRWMADPEGFQGEA